MEGDGIRLDQAIAWNHIMGAVNAMVLKTAIELNIFDAIHCHSRPMTLIELSTSLTRPCTNLDSLRRIMRFLNHMGLVTIGEDESYSLTSATNFLLTNSEESVAHYALLLLDERAMVGLHTLGMCMDGDTGVSTFEKTMGVSIYSHALRHPEMLDVFYRGMTNLSALASSAMIETCGDVFHGIKTLVDVGGGNGTAISRIAAAFPHISCTIFDLPHVVQNSPKLAAVEYVGGDMFLSVPSGEALLLMSVLHNWDDDKCLQILKQCKKAIPEEGGKIIIVDIVLSENEEHPLNHARVGFDMIMMAFCGGKERTEKEWRGLLTSAGFSHCNIIPIMAMQHVIEARP